MLITWGALSVGFQAALQGMATPAVIALDAPSAAVGRALAQQLGLPPAMAVTLPIVALVLAVPLRRQTRRRLSNA